MGRSYRFPGPHQPMLCDVVTKHLGIYRLLFFFFHCSWLKPVRGAMCAVSGRARRVGLSKPLGAQ